MTQPETAVDRIPLAHSVRYVARGLPEVPNQYGPGVLAPSEITLTYRSAPDSQLGRVHAYVAGRIWVDGQELPLLSGGLYGQHYDDGLDGWPDWLAEEARLHDPAAGVAPATDQTALRDRIAAAIYEHMHPGSYWSDTSMPADWRPTYLTEADAVLAVLPASVDRADVLNDTDRQLLTYALSLAADQMASRGDEFTAEDEQAMERLRRVADETPNATEPHPPHDSWLVELRMDDGEWHVAFPTHDHDKALDRLARRREENPDREWRLVRETTSYAVEPTAAPSAGGVRQPKEARP